jgi:ATP-dependent Clp protease ATP-binding subunit ClpA
MQVDSKPEEVDELDRRIMQLKIEEAALNREKDQASKDRLKSIKGELAILEARSLDLTNKWQADKVKLDELKISKEKLESAKIELENAQRKGDLNKAGELRYSVIPDLEKKIEQIFFSLLSIQIPLALNIWPRPYSDYTSAIIIAWVAAHHRYHHYKQTLFNHMLTIVHRYPLE